MRTKIPKSFTDEAILEFLETSPLNPSDAKKLHEARLKLNIFYDWFERLEEKSTDVGDE